MTEFINDQVIDKTMELLNRHMRRQQGHIERAYCNSDDPLDIALKVKFTPEAKGTRITTAINFVSDRVKDSNVATVEDNPQLQLFEGDSGEKIKRLSDYWKYTGTNTPKPVTLPKCGYSEGQWRTIRSRQGLK